MRRKLTEIFIHTHFLLRKIHYQQGSVLAHGVRFKDGMPNGGGWLWWWNWRALLCIAVAVTFVAVATLGTMKGLKTIPKDNLWVPDNAPILNDKHRYEKLFGSMDVARVILSANAGYNPNLMSHDTFVSLWRLHTYITSNLAVTVKGKSYKFDDLCVKVSLLGASGCYQYNPLAYWPTGDGPGSFQTPGRNVAAAINDGASLIFNPWTRPDDIFGGVTRVDGRITAIEALQIYYFFDSSAERHAMNPDWGEVLQTYEEALLGVLMRYTFVDIAPNINLSYTKELYSTMRNDWQYLGWSVGIMVAILALGFFSLDLVHHSRVFLGFCAAFTIAFAITSTQGASTVLFLSETLFDTYAVFLIAIVGLNHMYVIIHAYDRGTNIPPAITIVKPELQFQRGQVNRDTANEPNSPASFKLLVTETLAEAMPSITAVYLITIPTFAIGIVSEYCYGYEPISGLVSLASTCAFGLFLLYVFINLFFIPALVLDALRIVEHRTDVLCIKKERKVGPIRYTPVIGDIEVTPEVALPPPPPYERLCHIIFRKLFARVMTVLPIKIGIITFVILVVGLAVFVICNNQFALLPHPPQENLPSNNYLAAYYDRMDSYWRDLGAPASLVLIDVDYTSPVTYSKINEFLQRLERSASVRDGTIGNWYREYSRYLASRGMNLSNFYEPLSPDNKTMIATWLNSPSGGRYAKSIIFKQDGKVSASAFFFNMAPLPRSNRQQILDYAHDLRNLVKTDPAIRSFGENKAIVYSEDFLSIDEPWILTRTWLAKLVAYLVLLLVFSIFFLDFRSVLLIIMSIMSVASLISGILMYYTVMNISVYSISCLIMLATIAFDFHFQIAYFWMRDKGSRTSRLINVVTQIGTSLCCAYFTQFFGIMALMFSLSSPVNQAFAHLYVSITSFSFLQSVFVMPVILSWVGIRRQRIVIKRKQKNVVGGAIWDSGLNNQEQGDTFWSSDEESSFYHDTDKESDRAHSDGDSRMAEQHEPITEQGGASWKGQGHERAILITELPKAGTALPEGSGSRHGSMSRLTSSGDVPPYVGSAGSERTLEELFVKPDASTPAPSAPASPSLGTRKPSGGGLRGSGTFSSHQQHKRTGSGLRDSFSSGTATESGGSYSRLSQLSEGLHSFPSPLPTPDDNATPYGSREERSSWLGSAPSSRNGSVKYGGQ